MLTEMHVVVMFCVEEVRRFKPMFWLDLDRRRLQAIPDRPQQEFHSGLPSVSQSAISKKEATIL